MSGDEVRLSIRVSPEDYELWKEAAWRRKVSLSEWTRLILTATAKSTLEKVPEPK